MTTASDLSYKWNGPRAPAHLKRRRRSGFAGPRRLGARTPPLSHRRETHRLESQDQLAAAAQHAQVNDIGEHHHNTAVESAMPAVSPRAGFSLYSAVTLPVACLVACIYIGVPLELFTHDFSDHRLLATLIASALVFAAAFGGVLRVLRTTTPASITPSHGDGEEKGGGGLEMTPHRAGFSHRVVEQRDHHHWAEA